MFSASMWDDNKKYVFLSIASITLAKLEDWIDTNELLDILAILLLLPVVWRITTGIVFWWRQWQPNSWQTVIIRFFYKTGLVFFAIGCISNVILLNWDPDGMGGLLFLFPLFVYEGAAVLILLPMLLGKSSIDKKERYTGTIILFCMIALIVFTGYSIDNR